MARNLLREALTAYDPQVRARLQEAFSRQRLELKRLLQGYSIHPHAAEALLEEVLLIILPLLQSGEVGSPDGLIVTLTEQKCRTRRPSSARS